MRRVGDDVVLSSQQKPSMQSLIDAVNAFEPGFVMERNQPEQPDQREPLFSRTKR